MPKLSNVHLLKYGEIPLPNGEMLNVDKSLILGLAKSYDPKLNHEAPAILGHDADSSKKPNDGAPAFGWLERLYTTKNGLYGDFDITEDFAKWIKSKHYKKLSVSFYPSESAMSPVPNMPYMRHVAFLGAEPPVVKGLEPYTLSENLTLTEIVMDEKLLAEQAELGLDETTTEEAEAETTTEEAEQTEPIEMTAEMAEEWLRALLADGDKGYKDPIVSFEPAPSEDNNFLMAESGDAIAGTFLNEQGIKFKFSIIKTDDGYSRVFSPENSQEAEAMQNDESGLNTEVSQMGEELIDNLPDEIEEPETEEMGELEKTMAESTNDNAKMYGEAKQELEDMRKELAEMRKQLAEANDAKLMGEMEQFAEKAYADGKLLKSTAEPKALSEFMFNLAKQDKMTVQLSETESVSSLDWFKQFIDKMKPAIELNEIANSKPKEPVFKPATLPGMVTHDAAQTELHAKVISLCEQKGVDYRNPVTYRNVLKEAIK